MDIAREEDEAVGGSALLSRIQRKVYEWYPLIPTRNLQVGYESAIDGEYCGALKINRRGTVRVKLPTLLLRDRLGFPMGRLGKKTPNAQMLPTGTLNRTTVALKRVSV